MEFKKFFTTEIGKIIISIMLGLGIACLFQRVCNDKNCIRFEGAIITDIHDKIYKHDEKCYKYVAKSTKCNVNKKIIDVSGPKPIE